MRAQGLKTQPYKTGGTARRIGLCLLLCALVLFGTVSLRRHMGLPTTFSLSPTAAPVRSAAPDETDSPESCEITLTGRSWYALQLGAFTQENAAHQLSQEFIPRGAAGHICREGDIFRVYAAAYPTRAEAQSVQTRLAEQGVTTYIQSCDTQALTLRARGSSKQLAAVQEIFSYLDTLSIKFFTLSSQLDKNEMTVTEALNALSSEGATCRALAQSLSSSFFGSIPDTAQPLHTLLSDVALLCENSQNSKSAARVGAALKGCQLAVIAMLREIASLLPQG